MAGVRGGGGGAAREEESEAFKGGRRGWSLGGEQFRQELLAQVDRQLGVPHFGPERAESQEARAQRLVQAELERLGRTPGTLAQRPKGEPGEGASGAAVAARVADDAGVDCTADAHGQCGVPD